VVAVSTSRGALHDPGGLDVPRLLSIAAEVGSGVVARFADARRLEREALLELEAEVLCPCARHASIHMGNAERVQTSVIAPGANNPVTPEAGQSSATAVCSACQTLSPIVAACWVVPWPSHASLRTR
jgi:glutamate dehydrogenase/leucine dehydrogenase